MQTDVPRILLAEPTTIPATMPALNPDPTLDLLHDGGSGLKEFTANVDLTETDTISQDASTRHGKVWYQVKPNGDARLRVLFETKTVDGKTKPDKLEYLLEDGWLIDRNYRGATEVRRQVLKPGQKINLLKLGEGPFPLPIGQDKQDVHREFDVTLQPSTPDDPSGSTHLTLAPKPDSQFARKFKTIDVWVDGKSKLPMRIDTLDRNGATSRSTALDIKANPTPGLKDPDFKLDAVQDWKTIVEPFEK